MALLDADGVQLTNFPIWAVGRVEFCLEDGEVFGFSYWNFGKISFDISSRVLRTSGMGTPPKLTMLMT
jgi:hypothetical protein